MGQSMFRLAILLWLGIFSQLSPFLSAYMLNGGQRPSSSSRRSRDVFLLSSLPGVQTMGKSPLYMSPERMQESTVASSTQVLYQKVVRPFPNLPDLLFLGYLVDYLESYFELPGGLPMVYEKHPGNDEMRSILAWDSPLSPSTEATRMEVEVVGIYTDKRKEKESSSSSSSMPSIPKMAMVVVRKAKPSTSIRSGQSLPPMMANLFEDSEKRILRALDRGLEDFIAGKIKFSNDSTKAPRNVRSAEEAIEAELMDFIPERKLPKTDARDVVFDAYATEDQSGTTTTKSQTKAHDGKSVASDDKMTVKSTRKGEDGAKKAKITNHNASKDDSPRETDASRNNVADSKIPKPLEDYAIAAARRVQQKKQQQKNSQKTDEDFAVAAARKAAASRKSEVVVEKQKLTVAHDQQQDTASLQVPSDFKIPDYMGEQRTFRTTISNPQDRAKKQRMQKTAVPVDHVAPSATTKPNNAEAKTKTSQRMESVSPPKPRKPLLSKDKVSGTTSNNIKKPGPSQEEIEEEVIKAAQTAMDEIAADGETTPEQLLRDILKFGEESEKENTPGEGFVSAAFDKAKDLMREQYQKRQATAGREVGFRESDTLDGIRPNINEPLSAEEELKRMFEAGERIADGRIIQSEYAKDQLIRKETADEDVDALIANEKSISGYARSLDDQLVALEVAINKSPGEDLDGPMKYPLFDIMSGPEIYNPNVELDTINYPGAMPGTKKVDIPKELKEAIRQAEFAVEVLADLKTVKVDSVTKYTYGKQELSELQVQQLQTVASEAIEIGLIKDPIKLADESSRLQMVLDELEDQPDERFRPIAENFKDLLLSDNFVDLVKARLKKMAERDLDALRRDDDSLRDLHEREREILGKLVVYAQLLLKEARALGAELEAQQLEVIRSICQVAMDPKHQTEEETSMALSDAVRDMRPLLDESFVAYLKYAVAEEEARLARAGLVDDPEHSQWLFVLKIVQQGVYAEIAKSINRYIDHIWYVVRMETPRERRMLLSKLIDVMPTMDIRPFVKVVDNIVGALGDSTRGEFGEGVSLGEMTNKLLQLHRDVRELLPPERIAEKSRDADEWAARQKERLLEARKIGKQRLKAANDVADRQDEIDAISRRGGETERFDSL